MKSSTLQTPIGDMLAIADDKVLYLLEFTDKKDLAKEVEWLKTHTKQDITPGRTPPIDAIDMELQAYFTGSLQSFTTSLCPLGTSFQMQVWKALCTVPYGKTQSYKAQAESIGRPKAYRAVANANAANHFAIVVPCHRIITHQGGLGGYAGGIHRKKWLLAHELGEI